MTRLKSFVDFAAEHFGAGILINIGRSRGPGMPNDPAATLDAMTAAFRELAEYAAPYGVKLVLEPINMMQANCIHTTQEGIAMVRRVDRPSFGLMLDVFHMNIEDVDIYASFREASQVCWFVHVADNNRKWPGNAHLDFARISAAMNDIGYHGFVSLEILPWPDPDTAARSSIGYLRRFLPREKS
jgi:sugar phosphate isomerase/epimerase